MYFSVPFTEVISITNVLELFYQHYTCMFTKYVYHVSVNKMYFTNLY